MTIKKIFTHDLNALGIKLIDNQINKFNLYFELLLSENEKFNLTTITEQHEVYKKHFIDSLAISNYGLNFSEYTQLIDVGTGAGFPGIPLKIVFPNLCITLLDSTNKRISFLEDVVEKLNLTNINLIHSRAEELAHNPSFREKYDLCVSRAVANLSTLSEYCLPFLKPNGLFISYKSDKLSEELFNAQSGISLLGGQIDKQICFSLPNSDISRTLIGIRKITSTPDKYPRRSGLPAKRPL